MTRVILHGCNGKMGQCITAICKDDPEITIVAGVDVYNGIKNEYPVFASISKCSVQADVVIDFSNSAAVDELLECCEKRERDGCYHKQNALFFKKEGTDKIYKTEYKKFNEMGRRSDGLFVYHCILIKKRNDFLGYINDLLALLSRFSSRRKRV